MSFFTACTCGSSVAVATESAGAPKVPALREDEDAAVPGSAAR